jgi:alanyl-tRNA synthetase
MNEQRQRAKADAASKKGGHVNTTAYRQVADGLGRPVDFTGYHEVVSEGAVCGLVRDGEVLSSARAGDEVELVLDRTPFYAEGGGQLADTGRILADGAEVEVHDVQSPVAGLNVHRGRVVSGEITLDQSVHAEVDATRRRAVSRAHSATHLVHAGMRRALGNQAAQAGSLNAPGRLRFDFTSPGGAVPPSVLADVEDEVNDVLLHDYDVRADVTTLDEARKSGAIAFFGEKYGDKVRVITIGDYSKELCGGTHVHRSGEIGVVKLLSEASIGAGIRRVEALVGLDAFRFLAREHVLVAQLAEQFKARPEELPERIGSVLEKLRVAEKELEKLRGAQLLSSAGTFAEQAEDVAGVALIALATPDGVSGADLRTLAGEVRNRLGARPGVVALFSADGPKVSFVVATTATARDQGLAAGKLVPAFAPAIDGRGGGKPDLAQGGGGNPAGVADAVRLLRAALAG